MNILFSCRVSRRAGLLFFWVLFLMTGCAGRSADYQGTTTNFQFGNVAFSLPSTYQLKSKSITIQGVQVVEIAIADTKDGSGIDDVLKVYFSGVAIVQAIASEKGFNNSFQDISEEFGVPARWMLSSILVGEKEVIVSVHIVQERDAYLILYKADVDLDVEKVRNSAKLIHSLYRPEAGEGSKDFVTEYGFLRGLLTSSIPFTYQATYGSQLSSDYILIDYGGDLKHYQAPVPAAMTAVLSINPAAYFLLPDEERDHEYEVDGIRGHEEVVEKQGLFFTLVKSDTPVFEWWGKVPSPAGEKELTLKIISGSSDSKMYDKNLEVWDHLLKNITVRR